MERGSNIVLKITLLNHIRETLWLWIIIGIPIVIIQYTGGIDLSNFRLDKNSILFYAFLFCIFAILIFPALFIHIDYFIKNRQEEYEIGNKKIIKRKNGVEKDYNFEDIDDIFLNLYSYYGWSKQPPWGHYHFVKIVMKSGEELYLTSLLYPSGLKKILEKYVKKDYWCNKRWFPTTIYCPPDSAYEEEEEI